LGSSNLSFLSQTDGQTDGCTSMPLRVLTGTLGLVYIYILLSFRLYMNISWLINWRTPNNKNVHFSLSPNLSCCFPLFLLFVFPLSYIPQKFEVTEVERLFYIYLFISFSKLVNRIII